MSEKKLGLFLRPFKGKKTSEVIGNNEFQQAKLIEDQRTNTSETLSDLTHSLYNIFGIPLKDAASINDLFEDSSNFTPTYNSWESHLCQPEYQRFVPKAILKCIKFINDFGLREEGLYRVSGSKNEVEELKQNFIQYGPSYDIPPTTDVHAITTLIKSFARDLPEELLPVKRHTFLAYKKSDFPSPTELANFKLFTPEEEDMNPVIIPTQILQEILQSLSAYQFALLQALTRHFSLVVENSGYNRMTLASLSVILCPTLRMHKSVFHALIIKSPNVWSHIHPIESEISISSIKYDPRNIVEYRSQHNENEASPLSAKSNSFLLTTSSSFTLDSIDSFSNSIQRPKVKQRQSMMMLRSPEDDDFFNDNAISLDYNKIMIPPVEPMLLSSLSSFSDSSSNSSGRYSDDGAAEFSDTLKHPLPQLINQNSYEYRLSSKGNDLLADNGSVTPTKKHFEINQNRRVFLRK
jgi:hypothetical protein